MPLHVYVRLNPSCCCCCCCCDCQAGRARGGGAYAFRSEGRESSPNVHCHPGQPPSGGNVPAVEPIRNAFACHVRACHGNGSRGAMYFKALLQRPRFVFRRATETSSRESTLNTVVLGTALLIFLYRRHMMTGSLALPFVWYSLTVAIC